MATKKKIPPPEPLTTFRDLHNPTKEKRQAVIDALVERGYAHSRTETFPNSPKVVRLHFIRSE
jgi:hypothetical protein